MHVNTKWNAGNFADQSPLCSETEVAALPGDDPLINHPLLDDIRFMRAILDFLDAQYSVDDDRLYATGFSSGGQMTSRMAVEMSDRFAAIAAAAGPLTVPPVASSRPMPIIFSVGAIDDRFVAVLRVPSVPLDAPVFDLQKVETLVEEYLTVTQLRNERVDESGMVDGVKVSRFVYRASNAGASNEFDFMVMDGLGHNYPNGQRSPIVMVDLLWDFFSRYTLT